MPASNMNIRMDSDVKAQAQQIFAQFGLDMTTAINMFLRQAIREQGIPFDLHLKPAEPLVQAPEDTRDHTGLQDPYHSGTEAGKAILKEEG